MKQKKFYERFFFFELASVKKDGRRFCYSLLTGLAFSLALGDAEGLPGVAHQQAIFADRSLPVFVIGGRREILLSPALRPLPLAPPFGEREQKGKKKDLGGRQLGID